MSLKLKDIPNEDKGLLAPCGILCLGCDIYLGEGIEAAKKLVTIWEGFNILDVSQLAGMNSEAIKITLKTLKKYIKMRKKGNCPGCFINPGSPSRICSIYKCVKSKGFWTCAECEEFNPESDTPCPHIISNSIPLSDKGQWSRTICARYSNDNVENLKKCREIGYHEFIKEAKEKVAKGWRTWQIISKEMVLTDVPRKNKIIE
ncbi:MAG: DUF3795 domain-containing protein [Candidatus Hermodarchaeota archaeon]